MGCGTSKPSTKDDVPSASKPEKQSEHDIAPSVTAASTAVKSEMPSSTPAATESEVAAPSVVSTGVVPPASVLPPKPKCYIVYYSMYGHITAMVNALANGIRAGGLLDACIFQVEETLPQDVLEKMHAPPKASEHEIITADKLIQGDCFVFAFPTRFGMMCAQMKAFFDSTGALWQEGALAGKPAGLLVSTATQGGGQETTLLTAATQLVHHGMIFIPFGYVESVLMSDNSEVRGGSAWGAGTLANGDGSRMPSKLELTLAEKQGEHFARLAVKLCSTSGAHRLT